MFQLRPRSFPFVYFSFRKCNTSSGNWNGPPNASAPPDLGGGRLNEYFLDFNTFAVRKDIDENRYLIKNSTIRSPTDMVPLDARNRLDNDLNASQIAKEQFIFDKNFKMLTERLPYSHTTIDQLIYLPLTAVGANRQRIFVDQLLLLWWTAFERFLNMKNAIEPKNLVKGTMMGLRKIDESTNGRLSKTLGPQPITTMTDYVLDSVFSLSPKNFELFTYSLNSFLVYRGFDNNSILDLRKKLNTIFPRYLSASLRNEIPFAHHISRHASKTLFRLQNIGIEKPSEKCTKDIVKCFGKVVDEMEYSSHLSYLRDLHFIAIVLIRWSIDPDDYDSIFWSLWYKKMKKYYSALPERQGFLNALFLTDWLLVALKFDKEQELIKILPLWLDEFGMNKSYLFPENLKFLIDRVNRKYVDDEDGKFKLNEMVLTRILNVLERKY